VVATYLPSPGLAVAMIIVTCCTFTAAPG